MVGRRKASVAYGGLVLLVTALAFAVMFLFTPVSTDDFWYMRRSMDDWYAGRPLGFPVKDILDEISWRYFHDNARLSNVVFAFLVYLPHWLVGALSGAMCAWALFSLARLSGVGGRDWKGAVWLCAMFAMALPWAEHLFTMCYSLNYVWPMAFSLWVACRILNGRALPLWAAALMGLIFGAWHEGFSVPVFAGIVALVVCKKRQFLRPWILLFLASAAVGIFYLLLAPSFFSRESGADAYSLFSLSRWIRILSGDVLYLLFCLLLLLAACKRRMHRMRQSSLIFFVAIAGFTSVAIHCFASFGLRVGLCAEAFAIPGIMTLWPLCFSFSNKFSTFAASLLGLFLLAHLVVASECTVRINRQFSRIYEQYRTSPDGRIFIELTPEFESPLLALGKPLFLHMEPCIAVHLTAENVSKPMLAVPVELSHVDSTSGLPAAGRPGLRMLSNRFFIPADSVGLPLDRWTRFRGRASFGSRFRERGLVAVPFVSEADSAYYFYIFVDDRMPLARFAPVSGINW